MFDAGTGVAPMRALMHERIAQATATISSSTSTLDSSTGNSSSAIHTRKRKMSSLTLLLFGCRSQEDDYLYESEWLQCVEDVSGNGKVIINCSSTDTAEVLPPFDW